MLLPNHKNAEVPENKVLHYLLSENHPVGKSKAKFFLGIGFNLGNWKELAQKLWQIAQNNEVHDAVTSEFGEKFLIDGNLDAPNGKMYWIRTVWVIEKLQKWAKLVSAYPK